MHQRVQDELCAGRQATENSKSGSPIGNCDFESEGSSLVLNNERCRLVVLGSAELSADFSVRSPLQGLLTRLSLDNITLPGFNNLTQFFCRPSDNIELRH